MAIDLNADVGESTAALADGSEEALIQLLTSVNIACGAHAGDAQTMTLVVGIAKRHRVAVGAHPGYPDKENLGRVKLQMSSEEISGTVHEQIRLLADIGRACGISIGHVKPHGALYNMAARDPVVARAIADGVARMTRKVILVGLAGSLMLKAWEDVGFVVAAEAFADRTYEPDGSLRSRRFDNALITDPHAAAEQAARIVLGEHVIASNGSRVPIKAQTICIHGDTPRASDIATAVRRRLQNSGVEIAALDPR
ncbi:MAG: LamB/YcsF family protein [Acidobacteria bacterium]|nr:LamB/YcsF family protein [Acidobacteriota bacterium]